MSRALEIYDAVIVGGGPAGASAAIHLAVRGARVLLAEQKRFPRAKLCGEFISPECLEHFEQLGVADQMMAAGGARLSETIFYSRSGNSVAVPSAWLMGGSAAVALGLSRAVMDERLFMRARDAGAEVLEGARVTDLLIENKRVCGVRLKTGDGAHECRSRVTIDATGRARSLARHVEISRKTDCRALKKRRASLVAFKAHLEGARLVEDVCEIYFYPGGYGGLSRVEGNLSNLCFIVSARDVRACASDAARLMREIVCSNTRAAQTLAEARVASTWLSVALKRFGRHELVPANGLMAVGDAASFIDPFTGSGMLMALESGELAARIIADWLPLELRAGRGEESFEKVARDYRARYHERFNARLRLCAALRRAAFTPRLVEAAILLLGASNSVRRHLTRATRGKPMKDKKGWLGLSPK